MQKLEAIHCRPNLNGNMARGTRHPVWWVARAIRPSRRPWIEKPSTQESFVSSSRSIFIYNSSQPEDVWDLGRQIKISLCFRSSEKLTIWVKTYRSSESLPSEWTYYHSSENIVIRVKLSSRWKYSEWNWTCAEKFIEMISDGGVFNTKDVRIVNTVNFRFGVIIIRDSIWPANSLQDSDNSVYYKTESDWKVKMTSKSIQDGLIWKSDQRENCSSRRGAQVLCLGHLDRRSYASSTARARRKTEVGPDSD